MKKGLTIALLTVAVAMLGLQAMAHAPVIQSIPDPVVGSAEWTTGANKFVYPDAIKLSDYVSDDTSGTAVAWSYSITSPKYSINGVDPINLTTTSPITPGSYRIDNQLLNGETASTGKITIRNTNLSPFTGTGATPAAGVQDMQTVTLFASDGTTYSMADVTFYTENGGSDRLSGGVQATEVFHDTFEGTTNGFAWNSWLGTVTSGTSGGTAICFTIADDGTAGVDNAAFWMTGPNALPLVKNAVYHFRATMTSSNTASAKTPFWDFLVDNGGQLDPADWTTALPNAYGLDSLFMDTQGNAHTILTDPKTFDIWYAPAAIITPQWNDESTATSSLFATNYATKNGGRMQFRLLQNTASNAGIPKRHFGTLCLTDLLVERYDVTALTATPKRANVYSIGGSSNAFKDAGANYSTTGGNCNVFSWASVTDTTHGGMAASYGSDGSVTLTPPSYWSGQPKATTFKDLTTISCGDTNNVSTTPSTISDNYPIQDIQPHQLYVMKFVLSAPNANAETNPQDALFMGTALPTAETLYNSYITNAAKMCGMPKNATAQTYLAFYNTNYGSASSQALFHSFAPSFSTTSNDGFANGDNSGAIKVHSISVDELNVP